MYDTLYLYGDSYASEHNLDYQWYKHLGAKNIINRAVEGSSNDYIAHSLEQDRSLHSSRDLIIICSTHHSRQWFFEHRPDLGNYLGIQDLDDQLDFLEFESLKQYVVRLLNPLQDSIRGIAYSAYFQSVIDSSSAKGLLIPGFDSIHSVKGVLTDITAGEFTNGGTFENYYANIQRAWGSPVDPRANHMQPENHQVLAQRIQQALNGEELDLLTGFHRDCL